MTAAAASYCRICGAPIVWARLDGSLIVCDRQQTLDGDLALHELNGELHVEHTPCGGGLYREHVCSTSLKTLDSAGEIDDARRAQLLVAALAKADKLAAARGKPKPGTLGFAVQVLAREVRALRVGARPVDDAIDDLVATYLPLVDELPAEIVSRLDAVRSCRRAYYM